MHSALCVVVRCKNRRRLHRILLSWHPFLVIIILLVVINSDRLSYSCCRISSWARTGFAARSLAYLHCTRVTFYNGRSFFSTFATTVSRVGSVRVLIYDTTRVRVVNAELNLWLNGACALKSCRLYCEFHSSAPTSVAKTISSVSMLSWASAHRGKWGQPTPLEIWMKN